jgi:hypothetical protein
LNMVSLSFEPIDKAPNGLHYNIRGFQFQNMGWAVIFNPNNSTTGVILNISEESLTPRFTGTAEKSNQKPSPLVDLAVFVAAVVGRMPALGAWWNLDDWGLLGRAAGLQEAANGFPARILSQHWYWDLTWPIFGTHADPHTWLRLLLHGLCAVLVTRIAARAGLTSLPRLVAGLMVAATPLAFTPLYWAAGIQELLAAVFALGAIERWLAGSRRDLLIASLLTVLSMLSKEAGLGLPVLFLVMLFVGVGPQLRDRAFAWGCCLLLFFAAVFEGVLVVQHFGTGSNDPYAMGGALQVLHNLGTMGWWMLSPGPLLADNLLWPQAVAGAMLFGLWAIWSVVQFQQGRQLPLLTLLAGILSIAPALPLQHQLHPYLGYLGVCAGAVALASLIPQRWKLSVPLVVSLSLAAAAWGFFAMETRLGQRDETGLPADPVVRATSLSWQVCQMLPQLPLDRTEGQRKALTFLQIPMSGQQMEMADRLGDRWVAGTHMHESIGGTLGPRLILGGETRVDWVNALYTNPPEALVLCEMGPEFRHWGSTGNAALYAALADVGMGRFERARNHLTRAASLSDKTMAFAFDPNQMAVSVDLVLVRKKEFIDWTVGLIGPDHSLQEVGGLQDLFFNILSACTDQSIEELTADTTLIIKDTTGGEIPIPVPEEN